MHVQNLLLAWSIEGTEAVILHDVPSFSLMHVLLNGQSRDDPTSLTHGRIRRDFQHNWVFLIELGRCNVTFWLTHLTSFICALLKMLKSYIYAQSKLQHFWCQNRFEKLALIFLYNFHSEHSFTKSYRWKCEKHKDSSLVCMWILVKIGKADWSMLERLLLLHV